MENFGEIVLLLLVAGLVGRLIWRGLRSDPSAGGNSGQDGELPDSQKIYDIAERLGEFYNIVADPEELESDPVFNEGVELLSSPLIGPREAVRFAVGDNVLISCMAMVALRRRADCAGEQREILINIGTFAPYAQHFALKYLLVTAPANVPIIDRVLTATTGYMEGRLSRASLEEFVRKRYGQGEQLGFEPDSISKLDQDDLAALRKFLSEIDPELGQPLLDRIADVDPGSGGTENSPFAFDDANILQHSGRVWTAQDAEEAAALIRHGDLDKTVAEIGSMLVATRPRSVLLTGERGVGKTSIQRVLALDLFRENWTVFVAGHSDLLAGQVYIGQLEQRVKQVVEKLRTLEKAVWLISDIDRLALTGRHAYSDFSVLDEILPHAAGGTLRIVASAEPSQLDRLLQIQPRISGAMAIQTVDPLPKSKSLEIARQWLDTGSTGTNDTFLTNVWDLAQQYLGDRAAPGNVMELLKSTVLEAAGNSRGKRIELAMEDVIVTLSQQTGLPLDLLDPGRDVDLDDLKNTLNARVVGQDEAVTCLVDRVAMMKAGLSDPTRPYGVFLFAGPTGTGKTEIAKSLAGWLFGSVNRLIRVDMSELQTPQALERIVGNPHDAEANSLADQVRKQPFSVVLLDEFEKAHPNVWDLFLQIFDDARVTDRRGRTTSFRHTIIILTANLGATIPTGQSIGFASGNQQFDEDEVQRSVEGAFRREFINRLDRVIVFHPLDRDLMRRILHRELEDAFNRRGLKGRPWAVEWDESAIGFLLEKGFTPDLGARPLKRAVEQHLLSPLAATIVRHQFPEGDQFLFISRGGGALRVEFVDPSAESEPVAEAVSAAGELTARSILLQPTGSVEELAELQRLLNGLEAEIGSQAWRDRKTELFSRLQQSEFWSSEDRFSVLGLLETIDRVENGLERAGGLLGRLKRHETSQKLPRRLVSILAQNIYLLTAALQDVMQDLPRESFLLVEARNDRRPDTANAVSFAHQIADMYEAWADRRNMRITRLHRSGRADETQMRAVYCLSGYGAYSLLTQETGLHVMERPGNTPQLHIRDSVRVTVAPQPDAPLPASNDAAGAIAETALQNVRTNEPEVVRRYREKPSPLVRDAARSWRTGRLDLVLGGDFDLF